MNPDTSILTTKDFTILEVMHDRCPAGDPLAQMLKRKLDGATVVFRDDVPEDVATLSSRVRFSVNGGAPDTRIISHDTMTSAVGLFLPITVARGLALLGLSEGQSFSYLDVDGETQVVRLEAVLHQPEAARRQKEIAARPVAPATGRPALKLVRGGMERATPVVAAAPAGGWQAPDDPGPSAA
ncbi:MAG: nucleoside-diphosphate kinase [Rhizobiaceae bacterium]|nr:nucleoside-diphosphate kinase [Rhizobiaceae bacterium]